MSSIYFDKTYTKEEIEKLKEQSCFRGIEFFVATTGIGGGEPIIELLKKYCVPPLGAESICPEFMKYGHTVSGICDGWAWRDDILEAQLTETEMWKMVALSNIYWYIKQGGYYE